MKSSQSKSAYIFIALMILLIGVILVRAFLQGHSDGAEHNVNRTNQAANTGQ